jgi:Tfp pilus assembly protein PilO
MDKFKKLPPQYKLLIGIGFLGIVAGLYYYLVIMELENSVADQRNAYANTQKALEEFKDFRGEIEIAELREQYALVIKKIEENKKIIPDQEHLPQLMSSLETAALEAGVVVTSKEQKEKEHENFYFRLPIRFQIQGSYLNIVKFLKLVTEPGRRLVAARDFDIKASRDDKKKKKQAKEGTPFTSSGGVTAAESNLVAGLTIDGFVYTGGGGGAATDKKKK